MNKSRIMGLVLVFSFIIGLLSVSVLARASNRINFAKGMHAYNNHDYITAAKLFKKACDGGSATGCYNLGLLYNYGGQGVRHNYFTAAKLYKKACDSGNINGCVNLGVYYDDGLGVRHNYVTAAKLYKKACDGGDAIGCLDLGIDYANGQGVRHNYFTAAKLYKKVCDGGIAIGCYDLGVLFFNGQGVEQNLGQSYHYLYLANKLGYIDPQGNLDRLCSKIPSVCIPSNRY